MSEFLSAARGLKHSYSLSNKQKKYISSHGSPCSLICINIDQYFLTDNNRSQMARLMLYGENVSALGIEMKQ